MFRCGALVVNSCSNKLIPSLNAAAKLVNEVLYVPLAANDTQSTSSVTEISQRIDQLYLHISKINPQLDLRVILPSTRQQTTPIATLSNQVDALLSPVQLTEAQQLPEFVSVRNRMSQQGDLSSLFTLLHLTDDPLEGISTLSQATPIQSYTDVALGGTFDSMHNGHRLLLSQGALIATNRVVVGVANGPLLTNKTLAELIKPVNERIRQVECFLRDCKPHLQLEVVPITDVYGPTAWDGELKCLIASTETAVAIDTINKERGNKNLSPLSLHTVHLVAEGNDTPTTLANKTSSSELRKRQLAVYRTPKVNRCLSEWDFVNRPYLIGLTGNTACGKSSVARQLADKGAYPIPCDQLGHKAYLPGTECLANIVEEFGKGILNDSGEVDRKKLGAIVFADKNKLNRLNEIVWPAIWALVEGEIETAMRKGHKVCVVDAAVLLPAQWDRYTNEVWALILSPRESVKRVMERDGLTEERAWQRLGSQINGAEIVDHAHIVMSTQWEYEYTQQQVNKAWDDLQLRIPSAQ